MLGFLVGEAMAAACASARMFALDGIFDRRRDGERCSSRDGERCSSRDGERWSGFDAPMARRSGCEVSVGMEGAERALELAAAKMLGWCWVLSLATGAVA
jgi:hypothetical protein